VTYANRYTGNEIGAVVDGGDALGALIGRIAVMAARASDATRLRAAIPPARLIEFLHTGIGYGPDAVVTG
jgi:hypothetical protein